MGGIFMDNDKYMLGLSLTDGLNRRLIFKLLEIFLLLKNYGMPPKAIC